MRNSWPQVWWCGALSLNKSSFKVQTYVWHWNLGLISFWLRYNCFALIFHLFLQLLQKQVIFSLEWNPSAHRIILQWYKSLAAKWQSPVHCFLCVWPSKVASVGFHHKSTNFLYTQCWAPMMECNMQDHNYVSVLNFPPSMGGNVCVTRVPQSPKCYHSNEYGTNPDPNHKTYTYLT